MIYLIAVCILVKFLLHSYYYAYCLLSAFNIGSEANKNMLYVQNFYKKFCLIHDTKRNSDQQMI